MKLYSYPRCSTCLKAIAWLTARHLAAETLDKHPKP